MTYYGAKEIAESFRTVRKNTIQVAEDIPEEDSFRAAPDTMSVAEMLAHLAAITHWAAAVLLRREEDERRERTSGAGWASLVPGQGPHYQGAIVDALKTEGEQFAKLLESVYRSGARPVNRAPNGSKSQFEMLIGIKEHEMHHRAQLFLIERMVGIVPHLTRARWSAWPSSRPRPLDNIKHGTTQTRKHGELFWKTKSVLCFLIPCFRGRCWERSPLI